MPSPERCLLAGARCAALKRPRTPLPQPWLATWRRTCLLPASRTTRVICWQASWAAMEQMVIETSSFSCGKGGRTRDGGTQLPQQQGRNGGEGPARSVAATRANKVRSGDEQGRQARMGCVANDASS